jgi:D-lactate dehydrogenase (cytochrome)
VEDDFMSAQAASAQAGRNDPVIRTLRDLLGDRLSTSAAVCEQHGQAESYHPSAPPDAVAFVESTEEVAEIVKLCARHRCPVIPFGTGTSLEGHVAALKGGISIDLSRMNEVLEVNSDDLDCRVQAGVTRKQLNDYLRDTGLFFPIDPGADASLGGMAATRASGTNAVRYGTMRELLVGSEGTLGVITEVQLRLFGIPEAISAAVCSFPTLEGAVNSVILTIQMGIPVARIELLDEVQMDAINRYSDLDYPVQPTLFFEFHGSTHGVEEHAETVGGICAELGGGDFRWATRQEDRNKLWQARHDAYYACLALRPGARGWPTDVCVPISRLAECLLETRRDVDAAGLLAPIVGHVGDGNFHLVFVLDPEDKEEWLRAEAVGTCTGEHGVGYGKIKYLDAEHGEAVAIMRQLKTALDPDNIMNPGKIVEP